MTTFDPTQLSDEQLVAAANEYIQRTVKRMRELGMDDTMYFSISNYVWKHEDKYTINHQLHYKPNGGKELQLEGGNLFQLVNKHAAILDLPIDPPHAVAPMLPAPPPPSEPDSGYAEFTEVDDEDDVPF
jgi:hypothetical protein